jgi:hypothetical protein
VTDRPLGSPAAPLRRAWREVGKPDALSVVLGVDDEAVTEPLEQIEATILGVLNRSKTPLSVTDIARETQTGFLPLSKGLLDLRRRGDIIINGSPGSETVSLSPM